MIKVTADTSEITKVEKAMGRYSRIMPPEIANNLLRRSVRPMLIAAKAQVPVSSNGQMRVSLKHRKAGKSANAYAQGGATRRDLRIKIGRPEIKELSRVLVGVSRMPGKVGWRTPFITGGTKDRLTEKGRRTGRVRANNFLDRAYDQTISMVRTDFQREYREQFIRWAKENLPKSAK
ncbi:hypothetical protein [Dyadobacter fermentans]|uniref:hypothetical protein n=1 Tax=Dyadobacter fermentans TaxID=94254 RepID=UPI001CBFAB00|nr:hypothetical protein [Dyadobacter fermentans]MBZ1362140.1 hypothetical protein [Dyadobacter fermentans]